MNVPPIPKVVHPGEGRAVAVVGDVYRFLATGADTGGRYALWEAIVPRGGGPPPHIHSREEEGFYVLSGEVTFMLGRERLKATPGTSLNLPIGSLHTFKNETDRVARMLIWVAPAGLEEMFFKVGRLVGPETETAWPPSAAEIEKLLQIAPSFGLTIQV